MPACVESCVGLNGYAAVPARVDTMHAVSEAHYWHALALQPYAVPDTLGDAAFGCGWPTLRLWKTCKLYSDDPQMLRLQPCLLTSDIAAGRQTHLDAFEDGVARVVADIGQQVAQEVGCDVVDHV